MTGSRARGRGPRDQLLAAEAARAKALRQGSPAKGAGWTEARGHGRARRHSQRREGTAEEDAGHGMQSGVCAGVARGPRGGCCAERGLLGVLTGPEGVGAPADRVRATRLSRQHRPGQGGGGSEARSSHNDKIHSLILLGRN